MMNADYRTNDYATISQDESGNRKPRAPYGSLIYEYQQHMSSLTWYTRSKTMSDINVEMIFRNWFFK